MDPYVKDYYRKPSHEVPNGNFHEVIVLHEEKEKTWSELHKKVPDLPRGWFELAQLTIQDRLEFIKDFWLTKLPFHVRLEKFLETFFRDLEDIGIFVVQHKFDDPYTPHMVYSLKSGKGFFRGLPPASERELNQLKQDFIGIIFPEDYLAFLQIHSGFSKTTDQTGILRAADMRRAYEKFQEYVRGREKDLSWGKKTIDPKDLVPFYESFGMPFFQCFWTEWYPEVEMGNVYYSSSTNTISCLASSGSSEESMSFATFSDWLMFYLETIDA